KREETLKDDLKERMNTADVSDISIDNVTDPERPFTYKYKIRVPNYAQKTGKRMFLQPGFFEYGKSPVFSTATRSYSIFFHYPWSEEDDIEIKLPAGYTLDSPDSPGVLADASHISSLDIKMSIMGDGDVLKYKRSFLFGNRDVTLFPSNVYPNL